MHIGFITSEYPHPSLPPAGGIGIFIKTLARALVLAGHHATVFLCLSDENKEWQDDGVRVVQLEREVSGWNKLINHLIIGKKIGEYIRKFNISIIESADWAGLHAFLKTDVPVVTRIHGSVTYFHFLEHRKNSPLVKFLEKKALNKSSSIVAVSRFAAETTRKVFKMNRKISVIYNAVDIQAFQPAGTEPETPCILHFGTLVKKKGAYDIPFIFNELIKTNPEAELVLIGKDAIDDAERKSTWSIMQTYFSEPAKKQVKYPGPVEHTHLNSYINNSTVCIFPSYAEAFPISWLEAMAMKKSIVASSVGWAKEMITDGESGFLVFPNDHKEFTENIDILLKNSELRKKMGQNARKRVEDDFNLESALEKNIALYKELLNNANQKLKKSRNP